MSKRNKDYDPERKPIYTILYIAAVILLVGAIVFMWYSSRDRKKEQMDAVEKLAASETEFVIMKREDETESSRETDPETAETAAAGKSENQKSSALQTEKNTEMPVESETETETETEVKKDLSVLVLNGTRKPGVAAYWKKELEADGYTNVYTASYNKEVEEYTLLYTSDVTLKNEFEQYFPDCKIRLSKVEEGIEPDGDTQLPEDIDLYIVIGKNDIKNQ